MSEGMLEVTCVGGQFANASTSMDSIWIVCEECVEHGVSERLAALPVVQISAKARAPRQVKQSNARPSLPVESHSPE
jgi:hypothetical protein